MKIINGPLVRHANWNTTIRLSISLKSEPLLIVRHGFVVTLNSLTSFILGEASGSQSKPRKMVHQYGKGKSLAYCEDDTMMSEEEGSDLDIDSMGIDNIY